MSEWIRIGSEIESGIEIGVGVGDFYDTIETLIRKSEALKNNDALKTENRDRNERPN